MTSSFSARAPPKLSFTGDGGEAVLSTRVRSSNNSTSNLSRSTWYLLAAGLAIGGVSIGTLLYKLWQRRQQQQQQQHDSSSAPTPLSSGRSTAEAVAMMRFLHPKWQAKPGITIATEGPNGEQFGVDPFSKYLISDEARQHSLDSGDAFFERTRALYTTSMSGLCEFVRGRTRVIDSEIFRLIGSGGNKGGEDGGDNKATHNHKQHKQHTNPKQQQQQHSSSTSSSHSNITQLALFGAGFDFRHYRFATFLEQHHIQKFEIDLPEIQQKKINKLHEIVQTGELHADVVASTKFVPLDLSLDTAVKVAALRAAGFQSDTRSILVLEGVTAYLTRDAVISTLEFMSTLVSPGSFLLVTFICPVAKEDVEANRQRLLMAQQLAKKNEPHKYHPTVDEFTQILLQTQWEVEKLFTPQVVYNQYLGPGDVFPMAGAHIALARRK